mmetsp:Transcript_27834/g.54215  ORF Transcript_27834/g.54215 Transcript_27834/m.54215 type:complete len:82 (-) Transcript_27834:620-865(-)
MRRALRLTSHLWRGPRVKKVGIIGLALSPILCISMLSNTADAKGTMGSNFFGLSAKDIDGNQLDFKKYEGNVCYVVNVASK